LDFGVFEVDKIMLKNFLEGHRKASELIRAEKKKWLSQLTAEDSVRQYDVLCKMWEMNHQKEGLERLEKRRIIFLVEIRQRFDRFWSLKK
jgi:hypothetical protein